LNQPFGSDGVCADGLYQNYDTGLCDALVATGSSCAPSPGGFSLRQCVAGDYCEPTTTVCRAQLGAGSPCATTDVCLNGYCVQGTCVSFTTTGTATLGMPCTTNFFGGNTCQIDLLCRGTCIAPLPLGGTCFYDTDCATVGAWCRGAAALPLPDGGIGGDAGTCATGNFAAGAGCSIGSECGLHLYCSDGGVCTSQLSQGSACDDQAQGQCAFPTFCSSNQLDGGSACSNGSSCYDPTP
jgi:hypothetical protein